MERCRDLYVLHGRFVYACCRIYTLGLLTRQLELRLPQRWLISSVALEPASGHNSQIAVGLPCWIAYTRAHRYAHLKLIVAQLERVGRHHGCRPAVQLPCGFQVDRIVRPLTQFEQLGVLLHEGRHRALPVVLNLPADPPTLASGESVVEGIWQPAACLAHTVPAFWE